MCNVLKIVVCTFVFFLFVIVLSVLHPFGHFKLFSSLHNNQLVQKIYLEVKISFTSVERSGTRVKYIEFQGVKDIQISYFDGMKEYSSSVNNKLI